MSPRPGWLHADLPGPPGTVRHVSKAGHSFPTALPASNSPHWLRIRLPSYFLLTPCPFMSQLWERLVSGKRSPNLFGTRDWVRGRQFSLAKRMAGLGRIACLGDDSSTLHLLCALFLLYYMLPQIIQALGPGGWGLLVSGMQKKGYVCPSCDWTRVPALSVSCYVNLKDCRSRCGLLVSLYQGIRAEKQRCA